MAPGAAIRLRGWLQASHPFPILMVLSLTGLVGLTSARGDLDAGRLALVLAGMLGAQLAIGWTNDYLDRAEDQMVQPWKPVASGLVPPAALLPASAAALILALLAGAALGPLPLLLLIAGASCGLVYNLALKGSPLSWLPYVAAFAVLPPYVWASLDVFREEFLWLYPVAAPLTPAVHLANVLPDVEADTAAGRSSPAVRLGRRRSLALLAACLAAPLCLVLLTTAFLAYDLTALAAACAVYVLLLLAATFAYRAGSRHGDVQGFRCVVCAGVLFVAGWLTAV